MSGNHRRDESMKSSLAVISTLLLVFSSIALGDTVMDKILSALESGELSAVEATDLLIQSATDWNDLPARFTEGTDGVPCGTPAILEAVRLGLDSPLADRPALTGPHYTFDSPDGYFKMHWTDSGADAVNLSYATTVAVSADSSWQVECTEMNFITPPPDNMVGGSDQYDIYIKYLGGGVLGYTSPSGEFHPPDSTQACSASHIVMGSNISGWGQRACTVAHEFQHAVQFSYSYEESTWFMENCAVWMEEMVYPDVNDYLPYVQYGGALRFPWYDIRSAAMYWYGAFTWPWMMWNRWGYESVREIWEICAEVSGSNLESAHDEMFANHGSNFESIFMQYGCWRWFTADNWFSGCGMYNEEVSTWTPGPRVLPYHHTATLPFSGDQSATYKPDYLGIHWIEVDLSSFQDDWIQMAFNGYNNLEWNVGVIMQDYSGRLYFNWYSCDPTSGDINITVGANGWDAAIFFPAFMTNYPMNHDYTFEITTLGTGMEGSPSNTDLLNLNVSSNPIHAGDYVTFDLPTDGNASMLVYDMSGRVAATLIDETIQAGSHSVQFEGSDLSEGTYFIMLLADDQISTQKVVFTR